LARVRSVHEDYNPTIRITNESREDEDTSKKLKYLLIKEFPNIDIKNNVINENRVLVDEFILSESNRNAREIKNILRTIFMNYSIEKNVINIDFDTTERFVDIILDEIPDEDFLNVLTSYNYCFIEQVNNMYVSTDYIRTESPIDILNKFIGMNHINMGICFIIDNIELMCKYDAAFDDVDEKDDYYSDLFLDVLQKYNDFEVDLNTDRLNAVDYFTNWLVLYVLKNPPSSVNININEKEYLKI
jgi:hypothetical protein